MRLVFTEKSDKTSKSSDEDLPASSPTRHYDFQRVQQTYQDLQTTLSNRDVKLVINGRSTRSIRCNKSINNRNLVQVTIEAAQWKIRKKPK